MSVREATPDDVDAIQHVAQSSWTEDYPTILSRESIQDGLDEWYSDDLVRDSIIWSRALMLVAERDDEVVGFAHAIREDDDNEGNILRVYVAPDHRSDGLGRQLLEETRDRLVEQGVERINAMVLEANEPGNAFYRGFGFEQVTTDSITIGEETYTECTYALEPDNTASE
ncbi:GNAT family N-acetyltransferase [Natronorubrum sulfidifaciens]|uniref:N-acetyltransferase GCN5 n=1 Tax=Natronorubrum sulfidifaciens JCM 14089 TaxID=1230460 RepID=L9WJ88_9EURY|nr:GNAT family N-acetyltransferase [Natronorubrum sulfidifaciens]ELY49452.1 N-acetyltransferase GCN5 [Natronorubrum sulfidifaciens JCM 14089]